jgi:hypothetical protein
MEQDFHGAAHGSSWQYWAIVTVFALFVGGAAYWSANKEILGLFHDDGIYAVTAKSLAEGNGYRIVSLPGTPPQTKYPFLYSYLLSWVWAVDGDFPGNIPLLKAVNTVVLVGLFIVAVFFFRRNFPENSLAAVAFALLLCMNPVIFTLTDYVLSDLLLVLFALVALTLSSSNPPFRQANRHWPVLAIAVGLGGLTRSAAAPLAVAGLVHSAIRRNLREALWFAVGVGVVVLPWLLWVAFASAGSAAGSLFDYYFAYDFAGGGADWSFDRQWLVIVGNARYLYASLDLVFLLPLLPGFAPVVFFFSVIGACRSLRGTQIFLWSFFLCGLALLLVWPFHPNRYTAPLVAVLLFFFFHGVRDSQRWLGSLSFAPVFKLVFRCVVALPVAFLLLLNGIWLSSHLFYRDLQTTRGFYGRRLNYSWSGFEETFAWVRQKTSADSILATAYDPMYFLYTGRRAIRPALHRPSSYFYPYENPIPEVGTATEVQPQMVKIGVRYLIIDPMDGYAEGSATLRLFEDLVKSYGRQAQLVFASSDGKHRVYELDSK